MGTRSLTYVKSGDLSSPNLVCLYRQYDGYLSGHGADLKELFGNIVVVNGMTPGARNIANGMGCLAAQLIGRLKKTQYDQDVEYQGQFARGETTYNLGNGWAGNFYLLDPNTDPDEGYIYTLYLKAKSEEEYQAESALLWERRAKFYQDWKATNPSPDEPRPIFDAPLGIGTLCVKVEVYGKLFYDGPLADFDPVEPSEKEEEELVEDGPSDE